MPKERIYDAMSAPFEVQVGWHSGNVQVGIELIDVREDLPEFAALPDRRSLLWQLYGDTENLQRFGAAMSHYIEHGGAQLATSARDSCTDADWRETCEKLAINVLMQLQDDWKPSGIWSTMTRDGCNKLIRVLRRARDSAFGRDE